MKYYNSFCYYVVVIVLQQLHIAPLLFHFITLTTISSVIVVSATDTDTVLPLTTTTVVDVTTNSLLIENDNDNDNNNNLVVVVADVPLSSANMNDDSTTECLMTIDEKGNTIPHPDQPSHCMASVIAADAKDSVVVAVPNTNTYDDDNYHEDDKDFRLGTDIGVLQLIDMTKEDEIIQAIQASREYLMTFYGQMDISNKCRNTNEHCTFWSIVGECQSNAPYMHLYCAPACRTCHVLRNVPQSVLDEEATTAHTIPDDDYDAFIEEEEEDDEENDDDEEEEEVNEATRALNIKRGSDLGIIQSIDDAVYGDRIIEAIVKTRAYMNDIVYVEDKFEKVREICLNTHESCTYWSLIGECDANPGFMLIHCAPACQTCDQVHVETRCPMDDNSTTVFPEKDTLNQFYERIINDPYYQSQYNVTVLSRPTYAEGDSPNDANVSYAVTGLWVIQFDNIVNETEAQRLIDLGKEEGYERSADVGEAKPDGTFDSDVNDGRTSTNAWCMTNCMDDPATLNVHDRMENITGIPRRNYENLQILQYHENQFYNEHNDFIEYQVDRPCGSRILTFYVYLNTLPEEGGGGTNFPKLNLTVTPKLGRAILWPSILNDHPFEMDPLSNHQALPVLNGYVKYGFNAWIHQRDFQQANHVGCA